MNTLASAPVPGLVPELPEKPLAAVADIVTAAVPVPRKRTWQRTREILVLAYAYGLLGFGLFFPLLLAAWYLVFGPAGQ